MSVINWKQIVEESFLQKTDNDEIVHIYRLGQKQIGENTIGIVMKQIQQNDKNFSLKERKIKLELWGNRIGDKGCKELAKFDFKNVVKLNLFDNGIGSEGCSALVQANLKDLQNLIIGHNDLKAIDCQTILTANCRNLQKFNFSGNILSLEGIIYIRKNIFPNIRFLSIIDTLIGIEGFKELSKIEWRIQKLKIGLNNMQLKGSKYLSKTIWEELDYIEFNKDDTGSEGCKYIIRAGWSAMEQLTFYNNNLKELGCRQLQKMRWPKIKRITLRKNNIEKAGFSYLNPIVKDIDCEVKYKT